MPIIESATKWLNLSHRRVYKGWVWGQTTDYIKSNLVKIDLFRFSKFKVQYVRLTCRRFINHSSCEQRKRLSSNANLNQLNFRTRKWKIKCLSWRSKLGELVKETIRFILSRMTSWHVFWHSFNVKNYISFAFPGKLKLKAQVKHLQRCQF